MLDHIPAPHLIHTSLTYILISVALDNFYLALTTLPSSYSHTTRTSSYLSVLYLAPITVTITVMSASPTSLCLGSCVTVAQH